MSAPVVLILGAAGRLGQVLVREFALAGWVVRAQARKALPVALSDDPAVRERIQAVRCDATDVPALAAAAQGADVIVNALNPLYTEWDRLALPLSEVALATARASGALLMLPGNVYNFGSQLPPRLTEQTPENGDVPKARIRIEMEARLAAAAAEGVSSVVIRAGDFFGGPGPGTWLDLAMATRLRQGVFVYPGPMDLPHAWAYLPDLARAFVAVAAQRARIPGHHRYHFTGHTLTGAEWQVGMEALQGRSLKAGSLPWGLMRVMSPFMPMWRALLVMRYLWQRPHALTGDRLRELVGDLPLTPFPQALRQAMQDAGLMTAPKAAVAA